MNQSPIKSLLRFGQSPWLDFIERELVRSGELARMIDRWGIRGVTTNPAIFEKAITASPHYDEQIEQLATEGGTAADIYQALVLEDVREAADILLEVYTSTDGTDGFVSIEVSPRLVHDTTGTVSEAMMFWRALDRPNIMIKVPGTDEGLAATRELTARGINVNVTLLFSVDRYPKVIDAYLSGIENAAAAGRPITRIASVASFFLSRIDTMVDPLVDRIIEEGASEAGKAHRLKGEIAIASARCAYMHYRDTIDSARFQSLAKRGARPQRLLWASTGTKNAAYSDIKYVEPLVGADTVNTMPLETLRAYDDHGNPAARLGERDEQAPEVLAALSSIGIDPSSIATRLLEEGIVKFEEPFDRLHDALAERVRHFAETSFEQ